MIFKILNKLFGVRKRYIYDDVDYYEYKKCHITKRIVYEKFLCFAVKTNSISWDYVDYKTDRSGQFLHTNLREALINIASRRRE